MVQVKEFLGTKQRWFLGFFVVGFRGLGLIGSEV